MKSIPAPLSAKLASGVTTLCTCWKITRRDNLVLGFTDHDRDLVFGGVTYKAASGMSAAAFASRVNLSVDTLTVQSALVDDTLDEDDLAAGLWDNAEVEVNRVDWDATADRVVVFAGSIGQVERGPSAFWAELRSLAHHLAKPEGRTYGATCDADVGDARCGVNLETPTYKATTTVAAAFASRSTLATAGLGTYAAGWFDGGLLTWDSGANAGAAMEVKTHTVSGAVRLIELVEDMAFAIAAGDAFTVRAGCDHTIQTCQTKFGNVVNFRGFPHMPGNDWLQSYPNRGEGNDGASQGG